MAYSLGSERPLIAASILNPIRALAGWLAQARAARARRVALMRLLELDPRVLRDLGIERADIFDAISDTSSTAGRLIEARRARRTEIWRTR